MINNDALPSLPVVKFAILTLLKKWAASNDSGLIDTLRQTKFLYEDDSKLVEVRKKIGRLNNILEWDVRALCPGSELTKVILELHGDLYHKNIVIIKRNDIETAESLQWLIIHEITHAYITEHVPLLRVLEQVAINEMVTRLGITDWKTIEEDDELHEGLPEESFANALATEIIGTDYSRKWWRNEKYLRQL